MKQIFQPEALAASGSVSPVGSPVQPRSLTNPTASAIDMSPVGGGAPSLTPKPAGFLQKGLGWIKDNPMLAASLGLGLAGSLGGGSNDAKQPKLPDEFTEDLPAFDFTRDRGSIDPMAYYTYGQVGAPQQGEANFFDNNTIGSRSGSTTEVRDLTPDQAAILNIGGPNGITNPRSGLTRMLQQLQEKVRNSGYAAGGPTKGEGSGRDDTIEALLSDGEYVMDAETVALLGDGSNDEGARRLDEMRKELRKHKGKGLSKGKFSPDAKNPLEYVAKQRKKKGGRMRKKPDDLVEIMATELLGEK